MPYAFLNWQRFVADISTQLKMNSDPYVFPYTLQYVDTKPYIYHLKNIFFWGAGPTLSLLALTGLIILVLKIKTKLKKYPEIVFFLAYYLSYFLLIGKSAVKFMRYLLPLYPAIVILAGFLLAIEIKKEKEKKACKALSYSLIFIHLIYTYMFLSIYSKPNTRIQATEWILKNIPQGKTLAVEHWDDRLPLYGNEKYNFVELTLYDQPDNLYKWKMIQNKLWEADYIIIASNRLYTPIQKLSDCTKYNFLNSSFSKFKVLIVS